MSYDIDFVFLENGRDPLAEARQRRDHGDPPPTPDEDERRTALVSDILATHSSLRMLPNHKLGFSYGCWIGSEAGDCPFPSVEIGIRSAFIPISYSSDADVLSSVDALCRIFARHGYIAYDPQTDQLWSVSLAKAQFESTGAAVLRVLNDRGETVIGVDEPPRKRPWWRFW